jgi:hypothetical protein
LPFPFGNGKLPKKTLLELMFSPEPDYYKDI